MSEHADSDDRLARFASTVWEDGFTAVPNTLLHRVDLTPQARLLFILLMRFAWQGVECFPGQELLGRMMGLSERSVRTYVRELANAGLVDVSKREFGQANHYTLTIPTRQDSSGLPIRQDSSAEEARGKDLDLLQGQDHPPTAPKGRARASGHTGASAQERLDVAPDPVPARGGRDVVAAYMLARGDAPAPPRSLAQRLGAEAKRLLRDGASLEHVIAAAEDLARSGYGPGALASFTDQQARGIIAAGRQTAMERAFSGPSPFGVPAPTHTPFDQQEASERADA